MRKPYFSHLESAAGLQTTYEAVRAGFVALALEKNRRATPYVAQARALQEAASHAKRPKDLLSIAEIQPALVTAAGVSDKAANHLLSDDKRTAVLDLIKNFLEPAGEKFAEELVFRFLLTRGDTLGGSMRNAGGFMAQCKLTRSIIAHLKLADKNYRWLHTESNTWADMPENDADIELRLRGLSWKSGKDARTLLYNLTVPLVRNNVDFSLFNCKPADLGKPTFNNPAAYIALGELKGGIDPAGADEHWKTARTALNRIQNAFAKYKLKPHMFFIGAAIEAKMSQEIWSLLKQGVIENAANLTDERQIASITRWLCSL